MDYSKEVLELQYMLKKLVDWVQSTLDLDDNQAWQLVRNIEGLLKKRVAE